MSDQKYCAKTTHMLLTEAWPADFTHDELHAIALCANQEVARLQDRIRMLSTNLQIITNQLNEN